MGSFQRILVLSIFIAITIFPAECDAAEAKARSGRMKQWLMRKLDERAKEKLAELQVYTVPIRHGGLMRRYLVHRPESRNEAPFPVVFVFHGGGGSAAQILASCGLIELSDEKGFLLVAPDGTGPASETFHTWNVGFGFGTAQEQKIDDVGFFDAVLTDVQRRWPTDGKRIFATGISNGGILCHWLAAQPGTRLAAIAPIVATAGGRAIGTVEWVLPPRPSRPVSILAINGEIDQHIPLEGGVQKKSVQAPREILSASATVSFWTEALGCVQTPEISFSEKQKTRFFRYPGGNQGAEVVLAVVTNQGHAWPGSAASPRFVADQPSPTYDANREMWDFFSLHPRP